MKYLQTIPRSIRLALVVAFALRFVPALFGVITGDVRFHLAYILRLLQAPDLLHMYGSVKVLYHNPPVWIFVETLTLWLAQAAGISFAVLIKFWPLAADLGMILLLWRWFDDDPAMGARAAWLYALNPVSILVTGFHGQFDPVVLFFTVGALYLLRYGIGAGGTVQMRLAACLFLGIGIALKDYPALLAPVFLIAVPRGRERWIALAAIIAPSLASSLPFLLADPRNFLEALFLYSGSPDFGLGGLIRLPAWLLHGRTLDAVPAELPARLMTAMKAVYLLFWGYLMYRYARRREDIAQTALAVYLGFLAVYPGISAQYLFWVVPLLIMTRARLLWLYSLAAAAAMICFYLTYFPRILLGDLPLPAELLWVPRTAVGGYLCDNAALWAVMAVLLVGTLQEHGLKSSSK